MSLRVPRAALTIAGQPVRGPCQGGIAARHAERERDVPRGEVGARADRNVHRSLIGSRGRGVGAGTVDERVEQRARVHDVGTRGKLPRRPRELALKSDRATLSRRGRAATTAARTALADVSVTAAHPAEGDRPRPALRVVQLGSREIQWASIVAMSSGTAHIERRIV